MLKHLISFFIAGAIAVLSNNAYAQDSNEFDARLTAKFSKEELQSMNAETLAYWEFFVNQGYVVFDITKDKASSEMGKIEFDGNIDELNPLALGLEPDKTAVNTYQIGNTNKGIMILSKKKIDAKMNRLKK